MGTRSDIIVKLTDGTFKRIYCHWAGYLEHNGKMLVEHYNDQALAEGLVALGDLSSLGEIVGVKHPFEKPSARKFVKGKFVDNPAYAKFQEKYGRMCTAYGRDRGEKGTEASTGATLQEVWPPEDTWTEFTYVWDGQSWLVTSPEDADKLVSVRAALNGTTEFVASVKAFGVVIGHHMISEPGEKHAWTGAEPVVVQPEPETQCAPRKRPRRRTAA